MPQRLKTSGRPFKRTTFMKVILANFDPKPRKFPLVPQWLHLDLGLPTDMKELNAMSKGMIAITAWSEPIYVWVVLGSGKLMFDLAEKHILLRGKKTPEEIDEMVTLRWPVMVPTLLKIEPFSTSLLSLLTVHAGARGQTDSDGNVIRAYRYHR